MFLEGVVSCSDVPPVLQDALGNEDVERAAGIVGTLLRSWDEAGLLPSSAMLPILE
ncbi:MAG: hypothetical protein HC933_19955 [Pleurocapsa sp. SU_196_0]|nr:hypothetical protein [Pleurocapsa sp. SU_196_0]